MNFTTAVPFYKETLRIEYFGLLKPRQPFILLNFR